MMISHYLKVAVRQLLKFKTQNLIGIVGLGVCILCFSICMYIVRFVLDTDRCFPHRKRIAEVSMQSADAGRDLAGVPPELIHRLRGVQTSEAEAYTYLSYNQTRTFTVEVNPEGMLPYDPLMCMEVDSCFRQVFGLDIVAGSWSASVQTPNALILSESLARRIYGGNVADAIGRRFQTTAQNRYSRRKGQATYTVQAVMADLPLNNSLSYLEAIDLLLVNDSDGRLNDTSEDYTGGMGYALLRGGSESRERLAGEIRQAGIRQEMAGREYDIRIRPLGHVFWKYGEVHSLVWMVTVIGTLVLLVGLLNYFYFQIGTFLDRSREYSLRRVVGGNGLQLWGQLLVQASLAVLLAFLLVFCLIELLGTLRLTLGNVTFSVHSSRLQAQCGQYLLLVLAASAAACALTVARVRRVSIQTGIRGSGSGRSRHRVRNVLLGVQYFICWIFVTLAAALYLQSHAATSALFGTLPVGEKARTWSIPLDYPFLSQADRHALVERMRQHAGVADCLLTDVSYTEGTSGTDFFLLPPSEAGRVSYSTNLLSVPQNFFTFMHLPLLHGRLPQNRNEWVVDQTFARALSKQEGKEPLGTVLYDYQEGYTLTGISVPFVSDVFADGWSGLSDYGGYIFMPSDFSSYLGHCYLKCHPGKADEVRRHVDEVLRQALPPTIEPRVTTFLEDLQATQVLETSLKGIILFLAVVCVVITLLGVYAAITLDTERRRKEVAIRKVNGAGVRQILWLFVRIYIWIGGVTALLAFPLLYAVLRWWEQMYAVFFSYGFRFWAGILLSVALVTAVTIVFRLLKIARVNPAEAVKTE